jgi:hypothetical protein
MDYEARVRAVQITEETDLLVEILKGQGIESKVGDWLVRKSEFGGGFCCLPDLAFKCLFRPESEIQRVFVPVMTIATRSTPRVKPASPREGESDGDDLGTRARPKSLVTLCLEALKNGPKSVLEVADWVVDHSTEKHFSRTRASSTLNYLFHVKKLVVLDGRQWSLAPPHLQSPTAEGTVPA